MKVTGRRGLPWAHGLRGRLLLLPCLLVIFSVGAVSAMGISIVARLADEGVTDLHREALARSSFFVEEFFAHRLAFLSSLAYTRALVAMDPGLERLYLELFLKENEVMEEASVLDASGQEIIRVSRSQVFAPADLRLRSGEGFFQRALAGQGVVSQSYLSAQGAPQATLAVPIRRSPKETVGVFSAELNMLFLSDWVREVRLGRTGRVYVVNSEGFIIAHPDPSLALGREMVGGRAPVALALRGGEALALRTQDGHYVNEVGKLVFASARPIGMGGNVVVIEQEEEEAIAPLRQILMASIPISLALLAVALGAGFWFSGRLVQPVRALHRASEELGRGNLGYRVQVRTGDELEQLAQAFNYMAGSVSEKEGQILDHAARLEETVQELQAEASRRQEAEQAHERLLAVLDATPDMVSIGDQNGHVFYMNRGGRRLLEIGEDVDITQTVVPQYHTEPVAALIMNEAIPAAIRNGLWQGETVFLTPGGREILVSQVIIAHKSPDGALEFLSTIVRDTSEKKLAEDRLRKAYGEVEAKVQERTLQLAEATQILQQEVLERKRAEEEVKAILRTAMDGFWLVDTEGRFMEVNEAYCRLAGYSRQELLTMSVRDVETQETKEETAEHIRQVVAQGGDRFETRHRCKDGRVVDIEVSVNFMPAGGGRIIGFTRDITERKRAQGDLARYAADLARSNADLQQFAYVASHDLQEPLRMVSSFVQLLARRYQGRLDADADDFIAFAVEGSTRMQTLIADLLDYSRVDIRGKPFAPTYCEAVLGEALDNLKLSIQETGAVITHDPLPQVLADRSQLVRLFQNLIGNAIKFRGDMPPQVHVGSELNGDVWLFSVRDNGIGIAPENFERVLAIFHRLHGRKEYPGTGIGLAICKRIVERHGGRIWVESKTGQGSTLYLTIPVIGRKDA